MPSRAEVQSLLARLAPHPYDYTLFAVMLATGLRISEAVALQVDDIDRRARLVHVRRGKGDKRRTVMLSPRTLRLLERYWTVVRPKAPFLFPDRRVGARNRSWADHAISAGRMAHRLRTRQGDVPLYSTPCKRRRPLPSAILDPSWRLRDPDRTDRPAFSPIGPPRASSNDGKGRPSWSSAARGLVGPALSAMR